MKSYKDIENIKTAYDDAIARHNIEERIMTHSIITELGNGLLNKYSLLWNLFPQKNRLSEDYGVIYIFIPYNPYFFLELLQHLEDYKEF